MGENVTTVKVSRVTKERLDKFGRRGETYDQIIGRLLDGQDQKLKW